MFHNIKERWTVGRRKSGCRKFENYHGSLLNEKFPEYPKILKLLLATPLNYTLIHDPMDRYTHTNHLNLTHSPAISLLHTEFSESFTVVIDIIDVCQMEIAKDSWLSILVGYICSTGCWYYAPYFNCSVFCFCV